MVFEPIFCSKPTVQHIQKRIFFRLIDYAIEREAQREKEEDKSDDNNDEREDEPAGLEVRLSPFNFVESQRAFNISSCVGPNGTFTLSARKHSSRMRTARLLTGGVQGCLSRGVCVAREVYTPSGPRGTPRQTRR